MDYELLPMPEVSAERKALSKPEKGLLFSIIKIDCAYSHNVMLPNGVLVPNGISHAKVPTRDLPKIMAQVEPRPDDMARATEIHNDKLEKAVAKGLEGVDAYQRSEIEAGIRAKFLGSPAAQFKHMNERDCQPFRSVEVVAENLLAEVDEESIQSEAIAAKRLGAAIGNQPADIQAMIDAAVSKAIAAERSQHNQNRQNEQRK
jgi:hypothetical protein